MKVLFHFYICFLILQIIIYVHSPFSVYIIYFLDQLRELSSYDQFAYLISLSIKGWCQSFRNNIYIHIELSSLPKFIQSNKAYRKIQCNCKSKERAVKLSSSTLAWPLCAYSYLPRSSWAWIPGPLLEPTQESNM